MRGIFSFRQGATTQCGRPHIRRSNAAGFDTPTYRAVFANAMASDLDRIRAPVRILTDRGDSLHEHDRQVAARRAGYSLEVFSDGGSFSLMLDPRRWAERVAAFITEGGGRRG